jgi:RNA polymerase sigma-70 factor (ECF subfamily)
MSDHEPTEVRWLRAWRAGDRAAGNALLRRYAPLLRRFFARKVNRNADELVQRTLFACVQGVDRFEGRSSFKTYLLGIARNQFLMSLRNDSPSRPDLVTAPSWPGDTPSQLVALREEQRSVLHALTHIPSAYRHVLKLFYWDGCSLEEIASTLDIAVGTVKSRLVRGRAMVKLLLEDNVSPHTCEQVLRTLAETENATPVWLGRPTPRRRRRAR